MRLATNASPIQIAAMNQMLSMQNLLNLRRPFRILLGAVINHSHPFQRHKAPLHHLIQRWQEPIQFLLRVHDFDHKRQVY